MLCAGPGLSETTPHKVIFHPATGFCVLRKSLLEPLKLGPCTESEAWKYTPQNILSLKATYFCIQAVDVGKPAKLSIVCSGSNSKWDIVSESKMHLSSNTSNGASVCLDVDSNNIIVTSSCKCFGRDNTCDPSSQWFKLVESTRSTSTTRTFDLLNSILDLPRKGLGSFLSL